MKPKIRFVGGIWECRNESNFTFGFGSTPEEAYKDYLEWQDIEFNNFPYKPVEPHGIKVVKETGWTIPTIPPLESFLKTLKRRVGL